MHSPGNIPQCLQTLTCKSVLTSRGIIVLLLHDVHLRGSPSSYLRRSHCLHVCVSSLLKHTMQLVCRHTLPTLAELACCNSNIMVNHNTAENGVKNVNVTCWHPRARRRQRAAGHALARRPLRSPAGAARLVSCVAAPGRAPAAASSGLPVQCGATHPHVSASPAPEPTPPCAAHYSGEHAKDLMVLKI